MAVPDWHKQAALVMVYPYNMQDREHLMDFFHGFIKLLPDELKIILLVRDPLAARDIERIKIEYAILNRVEIVHFPVLSDIWIRDFAPLVMQDGPLMYSVKFDYAPTYVEKKYTPYVKADHSVGESIGKQYFNEGVHSVYFNWDLGNLTHNGAGTAIISNQVIADNRHCNVEHELKPVLQIFCGFNRIIFIPTEPGDVTGHVDGMVRFLEEKILVVGAYRAGVEGNRFMDKLANDLQEDLGDEFTIIRLENGEPENFSKEGVGSAYGNHINFFRYENFLFFPYYNDQVSGEPMAHFQEELNRIKSLIEVIPVKLKEVSELAREGGVLNCITWSLFGT